MVYKLITSGLMALAAAKSAAPAGKLVLISQQSGQYNYASGPVIQLARTQEQWEQIYFFGGSNTVVNISGGDHSLNSAPKLDFEKVMVLGLFSGDTQPSVRFRFLDAKVTDGKGVIRLVSVPNTMGSVNIGGQTYLHLFLTRFEGEIDVMMLNTDRKWDTVATFPKVEKPDEL